MVRAAAGLASAGFCRYTVRVHLTYDPAKREKTLAERGLDLEDASIVFEGTTVEVEDERKDYGERRIICYGRLVGRMVVVRVHAAWRGSPRVQHAKGQ